MKIILKTDYEKLGKTGDIVTVKDGFAMNFLIPNGIAMKATESNMRVLEEIKKISARKLEKEIAEARKLADEISSLGEIVIKAKAADDIKLFGSVTAGTIAESLLQKGFKIDRKSIQLEEPIKELGKKLIEIRLAGNVTANLSVSIEKEEV
ncbi:MAG: 50S ribosomal protein L9 [Ignavibacteria bacterium]|nr:50S ribosomal protein L9 [Ignavibacteria bacterium]